MIIKRPAKSRTEDRKWMQRWKVKNTVCFTNRTLAMFRISFLKHQRQFLFLSWSFRDACIKCGGQGISTMCPWILGVHQNFKASSMVLWLSQSMCLMSAIRNGPLSSAENVWVNVWLWWKQHPNRRTINYVTDALFTVTHAKWTILKLNQGLHCEMPAPNVLN